MAETPPPSLTFEAIPALNAATGLGMRIRLIRARLPHGWLVGSDVNSLTFVPLDVDGSDWGRAPGPNKPRPAPPPRRPPPAPGTPPPTAAE